MRDARSRIDHHVARFEALQGEHAAEPAFVRRSRAEAIEHFAERGFPGRKDEEWRATSVEPLAAVPFAAMAPDGADLTARHIDAAALGLSVGARLVFVNGRFRSDLSSVAGLGNGVRAGSLARFVAADAGAIEPHLAQHADASGHPFVALNTALWRDGAFVHAGPGATMKEPIHLLHLVNAPGEAGAADLRHLIVAEEGSELTIVESYAGPGAPAYWTNPVTEIVGGSGAKVDHIKIQREGTQAFHVATLHARVDRHGTFSSHAISLGGALVRNDLRVVLGAEGGDCTMNGLYLLSGREHEDNHTYIEHAKPHCTSRETYKGVLDGEARAVFHGTVLVRQDAQKTDARQSNRNLLLSDDARVDTKPQLEILADDVKCSHGATVGQLEEDSLFYLRSRGLDDETARGLLIHAFAAEILDRVPLTSLRSRLESELAERLPFFRAAEGA